MRIALVAEDYYPQLGGIPEHVHNLALELQRRGDQVTVVSSRMSGQYPREYQGQYPVRRVGRSVVIYANGGVSRITVGLRLKHDLAAVFRDGGFDVIHVHGGLAPTFGALVPGVARRVGVPVVATFHSWFERSLGYRVFRRRFQQLISMHAANIAVSEPVVEAHARYIHATWEVIPNGVDLGYFCLDGRRPAGGATAQPRLLFLHRLEPRNHLDTLLAAMPAILARHPTTELLVAGDGPWRPYYRYAARGLGTHVRFLGRIEDRAETYRSADLYLCPTTRAGFGITLLEAMACGTPMIVSDNPGFRAVLAGGEAGLFAAHDDPAAWADAVNRLLDDPARRRVMSEAGTARAARFGWPEVAARVAEVYARVVRR